MKKILFTTPVLEHPAIGGPYLRVENSVKALSQIAKIWLVCRVKEEETSQETLNFYKPLCHDFSFSPEALPLSSKSLVRKWQVIQRKIKQSDADYIINLAHQNNIDIIWFSFGNISFPLIKAISKKAPDLKLICDTDSVWSRFVLRGLPYEKNKKRAMMIRKSGLLKEKEEQAWTKLCDITTAVSEVDADYYRQFTDTPERVKIFSNVIDINQYQVTPKPPKNFKKPCLYLAGSFGPGSPMEEAARWIIGKVLPIVRKEIPQIHFYIVGNGSDTTLSDIQDPHITTTGRLDSVLPYLCNADISLVPLKFESGTRFKILESAACHVPVVSTTLGAEGLNTKDGQDLLIADQPKEFAKAIVKVINDPSLKDKLTKNCYKLVKDHYGLPTLVKEAEEILKVLVNKER